MALITGNVAIAGNFHGFIYLAYYPALGAFALVFPSFGLGLAWATITAVAYSAVSLGVGTGLDMEVEDDKALLARLVIMYAMVVGIGQITRFERIGRQAALERERQRERIELSQTIHDTAAQTAYLIGLGLDRARELADESNEELVSALDATYELSRSSMWELRHPIDAGLIFEGGDLGTVLWSHCKTFEKISGIPTGMSHSGTEPPLTADMRARLFSTAHNALTNVLLHASARRVDVRLEFDTDEIRLSVADDGVGLPHDYDKRGRGMRGMREDAGRMGGRLAVESPAGTGTTITCVVPCGAAERGE